MNSKVKLVFGISIFFLLCLGGLYFALQAWMPFMWILLVMVLAGFAFTAYRERQLILEFSQLKTTKHGLSMGSVLVLTLCFLVLINYFSIKFVHVFDLSMTERYTLSSQTKKILDNLDSHIDFKFFYKEGLQNTDQAKKAFLNTAKVFEAYSDKVKVSSHEMNSNPAITEVFGATQGTGEAFVSYKGKINRIEMQSRPSGPVYSEQEFINAVIKSTRNYFKNIYFLVGHKERNIEDEKTENGLAVFKKALEGSSYKVQTLNLIQQGSIPADADLLIIAGAEVPFQKSEIILLNSYLSLGKPILIMLSIAVDPTEILKNVGWTVSPQIIFNILNTPQGPVVATEQPTVASVFSTESDITKHFSNHQSVLFFRPHALEQKMAVDNMQAEVLVKTSPQSVGLSRIDITDYQTQPRSFDLAVHFKGKYLKGAQEANIIFISDVRTASNQFFNQVSNKDLLLNSVSFLAKETDLVSLAPKEFSVSRIKMTGPEFNTYFKYIIAGLFLPLPLILLGLSVWIWFRRRHA